MKQIKLKLKATGTNAPFEPEVKHLAVMALCTRHVPARMAGHARPEYALARNTTGQHEDLVRYSKLSFLSLNLAAVMFCMPAAGGPGYWTVK